MSEREDQVLNSLGGELPAGAWNFSTAHGPLPNPVGHTFPILKHDENGSWHLIGTGFYIGAGGLFVTARHNIEDVLKADRQSSPIAILHMHSNTGSFGPDGYVLRPIQQCWVGNSADIALGVATPMHEEKSGRELPQPWLWKTSWTVPGIGDKVVTYAFPNGRITNSEGEERLHARPDAYAGKVEAAGDYRDRTMVPYPYLQVNIVIHGAASGGPVLDSDGRVIGVNCTYLTPNGPGYVAQLRCLEGSFIEDARLAGETNGRRVTFAELVSARALKPFGYSPNSALHQDGRVVRLDQIPITAKLKLQLELYG